MLLAQSVPTADRVPCIANYQAGWHFADLLVRSGEGWFSLDKETRAVVATLPTNKDLLFWNQEQRDAAFRALDRLTIAAKNRVAALKAALNVATTCRNCHLSHRVYVVTDPISFGIVG